MNGLNDLLKKLRGRDPKLVVTLNSERSAIRTIRGDLADPVPVAELRKAAFEHARRFLSSNKALLGSVDQAKELENKRVLTRPRGSTHVVFQQKYGEAEVLGGTLSVHFDAAGRVYFVKSDLATGVDAPKKPKITPRRAVTLAVRDFGKGATIYKGTKPVLVLVPARTVHREHGLQKYYLCWQMRVGAGGAGRRPDMIYLIDAINGDVLLKYPALQTIGTGYYSVGTALVSESTGTTFRLRDAVTSGAWPVMPRPVIHTYDDANSPNLGQNNYSVDNNDNWDNGGVVPANRYDDQRAEVDLHRFLGYVVGYYYLTHGHNSWNGLGADVRGHAHNGYPGYMPNNAFWDSYTQAMYFGDGNGTTRDFFTALDVVAHEFTHGVNYGFNIVQVYDGETGAINEAIADMFGAFVALLHPADDPWPWHHGRQYRLDGTVGRNMISPSCDEYGVVHYDATSEATKAASCQSGYYPDHYSIRYLGPSDYHGVHWNCPILTHAMYLMINGGTHRLSNVAVTGIGVAPVEQMLFEVISTGLLTNTSDFADFRLAFIEACQTLFPENLDYLASVKTAFHAVGIGPDLYVRDHLADQGQEPGTLSCMSPDIMVRRQVADAATLAQIADPDNGLLCQDIELGSTPHDHYVYFRIFNRGSAPASGTFRLFISPVSTFAAPATWHEVGHYDFPPVAANGGLWVPANANECITLPAALISALGHGHFCFIGIIESADDPAPDRTLISNIPEFHAFISKSNNYAWRNCNIVPDLTPDDSGVFEPVFGEFQINGFGRPWEPRELEVDTRDLPEGTELILWLPQRHFLGVRALEVVTCRPAGRPHKIAGVLVGPTNSQETVKPIPMPELVLADDLRPAMSRTAIAKVSEEARPLCIPAVRLVRLSGLVPTGAGRISVRFSVRFPKGTGIRDVSLAFRERTRQGLLGQVNYVFKIRARD